MVTMVERRWTLSLPSRVPPAWRAGACWRGRRSRVGASGARLGATTAGAARTAAAGPRIRAGEPIRLEAPGSASSAGGQQPTTGRNVSGYGVIGQRVGCSLHEPFGACRERLSSHWPGVCGEVRRARRHSGLAHAAASCFAATGAALGLATAPPAPISRQLHWSRCRQDWNGNTTTRGGVMN